MATYVIGDIQGCYSSLMKLLEKLSFNSDHDTLWMCGDLVNRGPQSAEVIRFARNLGERCITVLGNHDLHLLAIAEVNEKIRKPDTIQDVLQAPDRNELIDWIRHQPLAHYDAELNFFMVHAGVYPLWNLQTSLSYANEVERVLRGPDYKLFLKSMYGNEPAHWSTDLCGSSRLRFITNCFTRMRYCQPDGRLDLKQKGAPGADTADLIPWFEFDGPKTIGCRIVFGHWSTLPAISHDPIYAIDTGCLWGGALTALRIDSNTPVRTEISCEQTRVPGKN